MKSQKHTSLTGLWNPVVEGLAPYTPGEQVEGEGVVKLNTNENPYPPSPHVIDIIGKRADETLRLYPDPEAKELKSALADFHEIDASQIFVGNGSDEVLGMIFSALFHRSSPLLFPDVTYGFYRVFCRLFGQPCRELPLTEGLELNPADYLASNGGILFPNPNAPTGLMLSLDQIRFIADKNSESVLVVDEAYIDFGGETAMVLLKRCQNLVIVRTFSKSRALAGLRIGYAVAHPVLIDALARVKNCFNPYPLDRLAIAAAAASVKDRAYFNKTRRQIMCTRERTARKLKEIGFHVVPSCANFVLASHPVVSAEKIKNELQKKQIWIRHFKAPRIENYVRITIGTDREMDICVNEIQKIVD